MILSLPPLASRAIAVLILLLLVGAGYLLVAEPLLSEYEVNRDSVAQLEAALSRYRAAGAALAGREATLSALRKTDPARDGFLQGGNESLIAANMQTRIKALAESAHGELKSTQILPPTDEGKLRRLAIRAQMSLSLEAAQKVFYGIESGTPYLFVDNVVLNARTTSRRRAEPEEDPPLDVQFDVFGYTRAQR